MGAVSSGLVSVSVGRCVKSLVLQAPILPLVVDADSAAQGAPLWLRLPPLAHLLTVPLGAGGRVAAHQLQAAPGADAEPDADHEDGEEDDQEGDGGSVHQRP